MNDLIERREAIKVISISCGACLARDTEDCDKCSVPKLCKLINAIPSADRPSGEVDAVKEYERQVHNLNQGYITLGEFDKRVEPLRHLYYDRPKGEWIPCTKGGLPLTELGRRERQKWYGYKCFNCNFVYKGNALTESPFCQNCGAKMKGADDGTD